MRHVATAAALVLVLTACGDGTEDPAAGVPQPTAPCAEAFAAAVPPEATDSETAEATPDPQRQVNAEPDSAAATLVRLEPTLQECDSTDDWLAGARSGQRALPAGMDRLAALRLLCDDTGAEAPAACGGLTPTDY